MNGKRVAAVAGAVGLAGLAALAAIRPGDVPPAPQGGTCFRAFAVGRCEDAKAAAVAPADVDCTPGDPNVHVAQELVAASPAEAEGLLLAGFAPIRGQTREVPCASLGRAARALTVVPLAKYGQRGESGNGPLCPPVVLSGRAPEGC